MRLTFLQHTLSRAWLLLLVAAALLSACSSDGPDPITEETTGTYKLQLQLFPYGSLTRTEDNTWEDHEGNNTDNDKEEGTGIDKTISSAHLFIVGDDGSLFPLYCLKKPGSEYIYTCEVSDKTPGVTIDNVTNTATFFGKIMVVANVADLKSPMSYLNANDSEGTGEDSGNQTSLIPNTWVNEKIPFEVKFNKTSDEWRIPMWGIQQFDVSLDVGKITDLGTIDLLRAVSKIVIKLDSSISDDYEIGNIVMADDSPKLYKKGYTLPAGAINLTREPCEIIRSTKELVINDCYSKYMVAEGQTESPEITSLGVSNFKETSRSEWYTYVAENNVDETDNKLFKFNVTLTPKNPDVPVINGTLWLSYYKTDDKGYSVPDPEKPITHIRRNHIYEFSLKLKELLLQPTVVEWDAMDPVYDIMTESYPGIPTASFANKTLELTCENCPEATIFYNIGEGEWQEYDKNAKITTLTESCIVQFYARYDGCESPYGTFLFKLSDYQVERPVISYNKESGYLNIKCKTEGASIKYTTDSTLENNSLPSADSGILYTDSVSMIDESRIIKARAYKAGYYDSEITTFVVEVPEPSLPKPSAEVIDDKLRLYHFFQEAEIYYAVGNVWKLYTEPLSPGRTETVIFKASRDGFRDSVGVYFNVSDHLVENPQISDKDENGIVTITCATENSSIHYIKVANENEVPDNIDWTASPLYESPISIEGSWVIIAKAFKAGLFSSEIVIRSFD